MSLNMKQSKAKFHLPSTFLYLILFIQKLQPFPPFAIISQLNHSLCLTYTIFISLSIIFSLVFIIRTFFSLLFRQSKLDLIKILMRLKSDWRKGEHLKEWKIICKLALNFLIHPFCVQSNWQHSYSPLPYSYRHQKLNIFSSILITIFFSSSSLFFIQPFAFTFLVHHFAITPKLPLSSW